MFHDEDSEDPTFSDTLELDLGIVEPSIAGPEAPAGPDRAGEREAGVHRVAGRVRPGRGRRRSATAATRRSRSRSRPPTRRPRTTTARRGSPRVFEPAHEGESLAAIAEHEAEPGDGQARGRGGGRARPRPGRDRRDHQLHQHLEPVGDDRRRPARQEGGREGARAQAVGEDLARAGLDRGHRVPRARRASTSTSTSSASTSSATAARPASATPGRCRRRSPRRSTRTTSSSARCSRATATSRAGSTRTCATTTSPRRRCASPTRSPGGWTSTCSTTRSARTPTATRSTSPTSGRRSEEIKATIDDAVRQEMFERSYADVFTGDDRWRELDTPEGDRYTWPDSTYVRKPSFFEGMDAEPAPIEPITGARVLAVLGDSVTTDHISPAGRDQEGQPRRPVADRQRRRAARLQLLRLAARQPRGDDPRHVRQRPPAQQAGRARGRLHPPLPRRRGDDDLRGGDGLRRRGRAAGRARRQGVRLGLVARLGGEGHGAARRPRGDRRELRAHPPLEPDRDGRAAAAAARRARPRSRSASTARRRSTSATSRTARRRRSR